VITAVDAELAGHADKLDMKLQSLCDNGNAVRILAKPYHFGVNCPKTCKNKDGYISLPLNLNDTIGITSYYCVILKIMILHDAVKTINNMVFPFSLKKKKQNLASFKKKQENPGVLKKKKNVCFSTLLFDAAVRFVRVRQQSLYRQVIVYWVLRLFIQDIHSRRKTQTKLPARII